MTQPPNEDEIARRAEIALAEADLAFAQRGVSEIEARLSLGTQRLSQARAELAAAEEKLQLIRGQP